MSSQNIPPIDRLLGRLGARRLTRLRPGMGWMLFELTPVALWIGATGAMVLGPGSFYFNEYLKLNGASEGQLAGIPLLYSIALLAATIWNFRQRDNDNPRHACLASCWYGRSLWLLIALIPFFIEQPLIKLLSIGAIVLVSQTILVAGMGAWTAWTQRIVPNQHRPSFFAYRHLLASCIILPVMGLLRWLWPIGETTFGPLMWYQIVFAVAGLIALLGTLPLQWAPPMPQKTDQRQSTVTLSLNQALSKAAGIKAYSIWGFLTTAGIALTTIYLPEVLKNNGLTASQNLSLDIWLRTPAMILTTLSGPYLARRFGQRSLIFLIQIMTIAAVMLGINWHQGADAILWAAATLDGAWRGLTTVIVFAYLQRLMPGPDRRLPSLYLAAGGLGQGLAALIPLLFWSAFGTYEEAAISMCHLGMAAVALGLPFIWFARPVNST